MNELMNNEIRMNHVELCELINKLRVEEGGKKVLDKSDFLKKIKKEVNTMKTLGLNTDGNFSLSEYRDKSRKRNTTFLMNRNAILQMASSESVYVRVKIIEYINALENKIKEQQVQLSRKQELQLSILNGNDLERIASLKEYELLVVDEATKPLLNKIEENKPLVDFAETIAQNTDSVEIGVFSKLLKDENIKMGRNKLYEWLRENKYLMKNNIPYQNYIDNGYFEIVEYSVKTPYGDKLVVKTLITGRGQIKLLEKLRKEINN